MPNKKVLACISTPLQYINVLELLAHLEIAMDDCVLIIYSKNRNTLSQIDRISPLDIWERVYMPYRLPAKLWTLSHLWVLILLTAYKTRIRVIGNLSDIKNRFLLNLGSSESFVVDDGANSIFIEKLVKDPIHPFSKTWNSKLERALFRKGTVISNTDFTFYTSYKNLEVGKAISILCNDYRNFKKHHLKEYKHKPTIKELWFVGAHFVKLKMIEYDMYARILKNLVQYAHNHNLSFVYFGHRSEVDFDVDLFGPIKIRNNEMPFELYVLESQVRPTVIASFYSSSLFNLEGFRLDVKLVSFNLLNGPYLTDRANKADLQMVYNYIEDKSSIQLIDIA